MSKFLLSILFIFGIFSPVFAEVDLHTFMVDSTPLSTSKDLLKGSTLIIYGWPDSADKEYPTDKSAGQFKLVNYVQTIHVKQTLKGSSSPLIKVLSTGTDRLPPASSPLVKQYPGPLAEGDYICFLKAVAGTDLYTVIGGWQGVYPLFEGKSIALDGSGFTEFNGLTVDQFSRKIKTLTNL